MFYRNVLRPCLFRLDPERAHHLALWLLQRAPRLLGPSPSRVQRRFELWGLQFRNRIGLAAGFDKNAVALPAWQALGFGFVEVGTVTRHAPPRNPLPRMFRCPEVGGLINRLGFPNDGAKAIARRLAMYRERYSHNDFPIGVNIGKSKVTPPEDAADDYLYSFEALYEYADFFVVNVSSPNTPGLRDLQSPERLAPMLEAIQSRNRTRHAKPIAVKIAPDLEDEEIAAIVELVQTLGLNGIVATNTTVDHSAVSIDERGGLSGRPLAGRSNEVIRLIHRESNGTLPTIGVGGVFTDEDYHQKIAAGASLVEIYTALVYRGPSVVANLLAGTDV
ncbi:MAG: quinone-dependent dihydroorotate dehydrogenase [Planctomycetes bacterium]|nr:quinone-dependent dihydroorotate dehydrogenase [Planctomycetota bacterium]